MDEIPPIPKLIGKAILIVCLKHRRIRICGEWTSIPKAIEAKLKEFEVQEIKCPLCRCDA